MVHSFGLINKVLIQKQVDARVVFICDVCHVISVLGVCKNKVMSQLLSQSEQ